MHKNQVCKSFLYWKQERFEVFVINMVSIVLIMMEKTGLYQEQTELYNINKYKKKEPLNSININNNHLINKLREEEKR